MCREAMEQRLGHRTGPDRRSTWLRMPAIGLAPTRRPCAVGRHDLAVDHLRGMSGRSQIGNTERRRDRAAGSRAILISRPYPSMAATLGQSSSHGGLVQPDGRSGDGGIGPSSAGGTAVSEDSGSASGTGVDPVQDRRASRPARPHAAAGDPALLVSAMKRGGVPSLACPVEPSGGAPASLVRAGTASPISRGATTARRWSSWRARLGS